jgi:hypothetical protein
MLRSALVVLPALLVAVATSACIIVIEDDDDRPRPPPWEPDAGYNVPDAFNPRPDAFYPPDALPGSVDARQRPDAGPIDGGSGPLLIVDTACAPAPTLPVEELAVSGDLASFVVEHGGGCGQHVYKVCWSGAFVQSSPVQAPLTVQHRGEDPCDAIVRQPLVLDLGVLSAAYRRAYQTERGTITLRFDGASARYEF